MILSPVIKQRFFDANGVPLAGGQLFSYIAGSSTPLVTYSNQSGTTNANPVVLDAYGYADVWIDPTKTYKFVLEDSSNNVLWTIDNVSSDSAPLFQLAQYGVLLGGGSGSAPVALTPDSSTKKVLLSGGASANPSWALVQGNSTICKAPTTQTFLAAPTGATNYTFTISSAPFVKGGTYTDSGGNTFTVLSLGATSTTVIMSGTGTPAGSSGTLTYASGAQAGNLTFSGYTSAYVAPTSPSPIYIRVRAVGPGAGGAGASTVAAGNISAGLSGIATVFDTCTIPSGVANSSATGISAGGAAPTLGTGYVGQAVPGGAGQTGGAIAGSSGVAPSCSGGSSALGGAGAGGASGAGSAGGLNTGGGGGGGAPTTTGYSYYGSGGGAGSYIDVINKSPPSLAVVVVGSEGAGSTSGNTGGGNGGNGGKGGVWVDEFYQ